MISSATHLAVGKVHSPFALQGGVKIKFFAHSCDHFINFKGQTLLFRRGELERELLVERVEFKGEWPILYFSGITSPEQAQQELKGGELFASRELTAPLAKDEFYLSDLLGLKILYNKEVIGVCVSYFEAAHIIIEVQVDKKMCYFPFIKEYFDKPDFKDKTVVLLEGNLLE